MPIQQFSRTSVANLDRRAHDTATAVVPLHAVGDYVREISDLWRRANETFVAIGRYLNQAKVSLPHGEFERMVTSELPFGPSTARKLRAVAEAIDSRLLPPLEALPANYTVVYEIATLTTREREIAAKRRLIRPDAKREEIVRFKKEIRSRVMVDRGAGGRRDELLRRKEHLLAEAARIREELDRIETELAGSPSDDIVAMD